MKNDKKDIDKVAKAIIVDKNKKVLLLKRSNYLEKYANEWDLPGGHLKEGENLIQGLKRETREETGLAINNPVYFRNIEKHIYFYTADYIEAPISLSGEHTEFKFFNLKELDRSEKFQKIAFDAIKEIIENE